MEDGLCVDESALLEVEVDAGAQELLCQQRNVEVVGVEAGEVAARELLGQLRGQLLERGLVLHVVVGDACQLFHLGGYELLRVDDLVAALLASVGIHLNI